MTPPDGDPRLASIDRMARSLDSRWRIPGTGIYFGVDAVVGLVPGVGDAATGLVSAYIVMRAAGHGAPAGLLTRMAANLLFDTVAGSIPVLGSVFDVYFKANNRNIALLGRDLEEKKKRG